MMSLELSGGSYAADVARPSDRLEQDGLPAATAVGMVPDALIAGTLALDGGERDWVPQAQAVWFKPLLLNVSRARSSSACRG
jgi:hypothetical protein